MWCEHLRRFLVVSADCAGILAADPPMRDLEASATERPRFSEAPHSQHNEQERDGHSRGPLNESAFEAGDRMLKRADMLGHSDPSHYLWCTSRYHKLDPAEPASKWDTSWCALRDAAGLPGLRFHDRRHTVVTRLEAGEDHVIESITGHLSRRML